VLIPALTNRGDALVPLALVALGLLLFTVFHPGARRARDDARDASPDSTPDGPDDPPEGGRVDEARVEVG
jgi:hypothetical protein